MGGLVLFVIALMALFEWALEPLMISLQRLFTLRELIWIPFLLLMALLLSPNADPHKAITKGKTP